MGNQGDAISIDKSLYGVILSGGAGTRFWPLSRDLSPKQLLKLFGSETLIHQAVARVAALVPEDQVFIVTNKRLHGEIKANLSFEGKPFRKINYLIEPEGRNTAPAIGIAAAHLVTLNPDAIMAVLPSDHVLEGGKEFQEAVLAAAELAKDGYLVTLGLVPTKPETGFGYIKVSESIETARGREAFAVKQFVEKPDLPTAEAYIKEGGYYWNSGIFVFSAAQLLDEMARHMPNHYRTIIRFKDLELAEWETEDAKEAFKALEPISIDYGVMERASKIAVVPVSLDWHDVGSFSAIADFYQKDKDGNVVVGNALNIESKDSIIYADKRLVATLGLEDMVVIDTHDATLVCPKDRVQDVRKVTDVLKSNQAREFLTHRTVYRPWGSYTLLETGPNFQIKIVEVKPGSKLSLQLHHHRSEHWVVISGSARVTRGDELIDLHVGESTFIPMSTVHRLENTGIIALKVIEVQNGEYLEEDDIQRFEDDYERQVEDR
ncbi:MAG: mannose-1-phosphate guanylyltransferase/mannose-6-phosphate isomerase [Candidatus Aquicultorales bacterium]